MPVNPYQGISGKKLYKGDIHFHTDRSDGLSSAEAMFERLIACGFDFCSVADHDVPRGAGAYNGLVILPGQEMSSSDGHIVALNVSGVRDAAWTVAEQIRFVRACGGMAILSHPKIREFVADQSLAYAPERLVNELGLEFDGMEIFTRNVGSGFKNAIDRLDAAWTASLAKASFKPVWGIASSDGHEVGHITENTGIMAWSASRKPDDLLKAIFAGSFYCIADSLARFENISFDGVRLDAVAANCRMMRLVVKGGEIADCAYCPEGIPCHMRHEATGKEGYLRLEAYDAHGKCAYSNPIGV